MNRQEIPFFFRNDAWRLFGVLHRPADRDAKEGFVFCAPLAEEKLWTQRVYVSFARLMADLGYPVLRFDYMGNGDSEGDFRECSVATMLADIACAVRTLREQVPALESVILLGLRFGATLAALSASDEVHTLGKLILWEPIVDGSAYMREMLRVNLATQVSAYKTIQHDTSALVYRMKQGHTVNVDGYEMSWPLYVQCEAINLLNQVNTFQGPTLIVNIARKKDEVSGVLKNLQSRFRSACAVLAVEEPFWKEVRRFYGRADNLFRATLEWLEESWDGRR